VRDASGIAAGEGGGGRDGVVEGRFRGGFEEASSGRSLRGGREEADGGHGCGGSRKRRRRAARRRPPRPMWLWVGDKPSGGEGGRLDGSNELCLTFFFSSSVF
jgi:hypothetical protein